MSANGRAVVGGDDAASDSLESESMVVVLLSAVFPQIPADGVKELLDAIAVGIDVLRRCDAALRCPLAADLVQAVMQGDTSRARSIIYSQCSRTKAIQDAEAALERRRPPRNDRPPRASRSDRRPHKRVIYTRTPEVSTSEGDEPGLGTSQGSSDSVASSPKPRGNGSGWSRSWQIPSTGPSFPSGSSRTRRYSAERQPLTTHEVPSTRRRPAEKPRPVSFWVPLGSEPSSDRHGRQRTLPSDSALRGHPLDPRETDERRPRGLRSSPSRGRTTGYGIEYTPRPQRQPSQHEAVQPQSPAAWATSVHASTSPHASASTANGMSARRTRGGEPRPSAPADAYAHIYDRDVGPISASYPTEPRLQRDTSQSGWTELNASPFRP
eukprot:m.444215 g.444215  ORF g.444215 m.444215 type:complete len:381 (-) comp19068_c0_seq1:774-1916(-)